MVQKLRALAVLPEDLDLVPSTHTRQLTAFCNYSSRTSTASPGLCRRLHTYSTDSPHTETHLKNQITSGKTISVMFS